MNCFLEQLETDRRLKQPARVMNCFLEQLETDGVSATCSCHELLP